MRSGRSGQVPAVLVAVAFGLAGCGGDGSEEAAPDPTEAAATDTTEADASPGTTPADTSATETAPPDGNGGSDPDSITIRNFDYGEPLTVEAGTTVTVTNSDGVGHTLTSDEDLFDSGFLNPGDSAELQFDEPGDYSFFCTVHPTMAGSITVA